MCHVMATWELCALYGSHVCYMGAVCTIWELHALYKSRMGGVNQLCTLNQVSAILEPCSPYGDTIGATWEPCGTMLNPCALYVPYGSHQA
jgi:hypothetical protein